MIINQLGLFLLWYITIKTYVTSQLPVFYRLVPGNIREVSAIALLTNLDPKNTPQQIYEFYKCRAAVEILFDTYKNILFADVTYTRSNEALEGWLFINHIALIFYYRLYKRLMQHNLLKKYSPKDILMHLNTIKRVKINQKWVIAEIPTKSKTILEKLEIPITYQ